MRLLHWAAAAVRPDNTAACQRAARELGQQTTDVELRELWPRIANATRRTAAGAALAATIHPSRPAQPQRPAP